MDKEEFEVNMNAELAQISSLLSIPLPEIVSSSTEALVESSNKFLVRIIIYIKKE